MAKMVLITRLVTPRKEILPSDFIPGGLPFIIFLLIFLHPHNLSAQAATRAQNNDELLFEHYTQEKGLSQGTGYAITSFNNYLWFGTQDGLNRFDGYSFRVFRTNDGKAQNNSIIQTLLTDSKNRLWAGTGVGVYLFNSNKEKLEKFSFVFKIRHAVSEVPIRKIVEDGFGNIWILTAEEGLFRYSDKTNQLTTYFPKSNHLVDIAVDKAGIIWITSDRKVHKYETSKDAFEVVDILKRLDSHDDIMLKCMVFDEKNALWLGTYEHGIYVIENETKQNSIQYTLSGFSKTRGQGKEINCLIKDQKGNIWIGTRTDGIYFFNSKDRKFQHAENSATNSKSLADNHIWSLYEDKQGIVWVGLSSKGIDKYDPGRMAFRWIHKYSEPTGQALTDNMIFSLHASRDNLYVGTESGGLSVFNIKTEKLSKLHGVNAPNEVRGLSSDEDGKIWLVNFRGLFQYDPETKKFTSSARDESSEAIYLYAVHVLKKRKEVWVGGQRGLAILDLVTRKWKSLNCWPELKKISSHTIRIIKEDPSGIIWLGTLGHGLFRFDPSNGQVISFDTKNGLDCENIRSLNTNGGILWIGTDCGLFPMNLRNLKIKAHYTQQSEDYKFRLPNDVIYSILPDGENLWLSTNKGLTFFSPKYGVKDNFDMRDGLPGNEFNTNCAYKGNHGKLYFGGVNGISYFEPGLLRKNTYIPPVKIDKVLVLDSIYSANDKKIMLNHDQNFIDFEFVALNFSNADKNKYRYKLEGIDKTWNEAGTRRYANYTNLPPGDYIFKVIGSNNDDVWSKNPATLSIQIAPPWWATWWFRSIFFLALFTSVFAVFRYRIYEIKRQRNNEILLTQRTQELERQRFSKELHDGVGTNLSILKMYFSSFGKGILGIDKLVERSDSLLKESLEDIRRLIHDMHPRNLHELGLSQAIFEMIQLVNQGGQIHVEFSHEEIPEKLPESVEINIFRIVQELIQNALKHSGGNRVELKLTYIKGELIVNYSDNGAGFKPDSSKQRGGNGLLNIRQRIQLLKGIVNFESTVGTGTKILLAVPV